MSNLRIFSSNICDFYEDIFWPNFVLRWLGVTPLKITEINQMRKLIKIKIITRYKLIYCVYLTLILLFYIGGGYSFPLETVSTTLIKLFVIYIFVIHIVLNILIRIFMNSTIEILKLLTNFMRIHDTFSQYGLTIGFTRSKVLLSSWGLVYLSVLFLNSSAETYHDSSFSIFCFRFSNLLLLTMGSLLHNTARLAVCRVGTYMKLANNYIVNFCIAFNESSKNIITITRLHYELCDSVILINKIYSNLILTIFSINFIGIVVGLHQDIDIIIRMSFSSRSFKVIEYLMTIIDTIINILVFSSVSKWVSMKPPLCTYSCHVDKKLTKT